MDSVSDCRSRDRKFESKLSHTIFVEIDREIISRVILPLPLIHKGQLSVCGESMCTNYWLISLDIFYLFSDKMIAMVLHYKISHEKKNISNKQRDIY